jgi:predicted CXXCH cytochrome family protein
VLWLGLCITAAAQISTDVLGQHAFGPGATGPVQGTLAAPCQYCHAPHSGLNNALWNQKLTTQTYTAYTSSTYVEKGNTTVPPMTNTNLCLSCHDGTVAAGTSIVYGQIASGALLATDTIATLQSSHPVSLMLPLTDAADLLAGVSGGTTGNPAVVMTQGNIECTTCHNPHVETVDPVAKQFLAMNGSNGALCLSCHDPNRVLNGVTSPLNGWAQSIHATSTATVQNLPYATLAANACINCHTDHNAAGADWLLQGAGDQVCLNCHSSTAANANATSPSNGVSVTGLRPSKPAPRLMGPAAMMAKLNIASEYAKVGHTAANPGNLASPPAATPKLIKGTAAGQAPATPNDPTLSGCTDCHNPHAVQAVGSFSGAPASRPTQARVSGLSENGSTLVKAAPDQYETCLRCHGARSVKTASAKFGYEPTRSGAGGEPLNLVPQFSASARSAHPVARNRMGILPQPSLRQNMLNLDGSTQGRAMGDRIFCTDCHNSDDNREFGGSGPAGPHGSKWSHILERRYEFSQAITPGGAISMLNPTPDLGSRGPYALCAKCHDLQNVVQNTSFRQHGEHINSGFGCSTCHTAHGMESNGVNSSGERLVNFDLNVVAASSGLPISYSRGSDTCTLTCHNAVHHPDGTVTTATAGMKIRK